MCHSVKIRALRKVFNAEPVLDDLNLDIKVGEIFAIMGVSGAGKSSLLSIMSALQIFDAGSVVINNVELFNITEIQRKDLMLSISYLFQNSGLFDAMTLLENVAFRHLYHLRMQKRKAIDIAREKLLYVGIDESSMHLYPSQISGGMKKKVGIARALASNAKIVFLDEPTSGLDPISTNVISNIILNCSKNLGMTIVLVTHDINTVNKIADSVGLLHKGRMSWIGSSKEFFSENNQITYQFCNANIE